MKVILKKSATLRVQTGIRLRKGPLAAAHWLHLGSSTDSLLLYTHSSNVPFYCSTFIGKLDPSQDRYTKRRRESLFTENKGVGNEA